MELDLFRVLLQPEGQSALRAAAALDPTESRFLSCFEKLRKQFPADLARSALETAILRIKARAKFAHAQAMYFTREALEQSSGETVTGYRSSRYQGFGHVADLCCGIGGDTLGLARQGLQVTAVDRDPLRAAMARANVAASGLADRVDVREGDALTSPLPDAEAGFADPSRREGTRRHLSPLDYIPSVPELRDRFAAGFPLGVKIAPGVNLHDLDGFDAEAEFISVAGELKECVLWFGPLRTVPRRATVLPGPHTLTAPSPPNPRDTQPIGEFLLDPDPAIARAGLLFQLAELLDANPIEPGFTLLTCRNLCHSPFATVYRVEWSARHNPRRLREELRGKGVGRVTMIKRGTAIDSDELARQLKLRGEGHRSVILTRAGGEPVMVVAERLDVSQAGY